jgi:hypothetical protein
MQKQAILEEIQVPVPPSLVIMTLTRDDPAFSFLFHSSSIIFLLLEPEASTKVCSVQFSSPFLKIHVSVSLMSCFQSFEQS